MNLMHCGKTVVLSYDKIEKNQQLMSFVGQLGCEIIHIKPKNLFLAKYFLKLKGIVKSLFTSRE